MDLACTSVSLAVANAARRCRRLVGTAEFRRVSLIGSPAPTARFRCCPLFVFSFGVGLSPDRAGRACGVCDVLHGPATSAVCCIARLGPSVSSRSDRPPAAPVQSGHPHLFARLVLLVSHLQDVIAPPGLAQ
ncbi:hypothetical protein IQ06DRAFT_309443 [Phaeosphaeriaceae sp. SRC1lsM3a]|nr:hypothetical protein IQ06DRAFT_309443 [Stagonospora sp. SRC1lsM3a]